MTESAAVASEAVAPVDASAAPVRERGLRTRAGNAMGRTRAAVLDGAVRAVEKYGMRKATMADIASLSGIAKGTLYNHFRTKDAVLAAAVDAAVAELGVECAQLAGEDLAAALALAAERVSTNPALRRVAADEPAVLGALLRMDDSPRWRAARAAASAVLAAAGRTDDAGGVDTLLRWVASHAATAGTDEAIRRGAEVLAAGLPVAGQPVSPGGSLAPPPAE